MKTDYWLPTFEILTSEGYTWTTCMAGWVTLADAKAYFIGRSFEVGEPEHLDVVVSVKELPPTHATPNINR